MEYSSCTSALRVASRTTLTASTLLVKSTNPSGTMPTSAATQLMIAERKSVPERKISLQNSAIPTGTRMMPIILMILLIDAIISLAFFFTYFALPVIFDA